MPTHYATWHTLADYFLGLAPAFSVFVALLMALPRDLALLRILLHIAFFVLARDAMTQSGLWQISAGSLRFTAQPGVLLGLAAVSLALGFAVYGLERPARQGLCWVRRGVWDAVAVGVGAAVFITVIAAALQWLFALPSLPAPTSGSILALLAVLALALAGNAYEELLFRGLLQTQLMQSLSAQRAAWVSGLFFCLCHAYLATIATSVGAPILVFTALEGCVAAFVYLRAGLLGAMLCHGLAIAALACRVF